MSNKTLSEVPPTEAPETALDFTSTKYASPAQIAKIFPGLTLRRLANMRSAGKGPLFFKPTEKTVIYDLEKFEEWLQTTRQPTRDQT